MISRNISIDLKDGFTVERKALTLNLNKDRRYVLYHNGRRIASNCLYKDIVVILNNIRKGGCK